jgi:bisphosphoglycerate-independent phosphoglycerate mutase (AlkP superfamily)
VLEYLNRQDVFRGKVVAFSSWNILPFIFNEARCGFSVNSGNETLDDKDEQSLMINAVQQNEPEKSHTRNDQLTYLSAKEYIIQHHPKALFLGLGETDEFAHQGRYDMYLQKAEAFDKMIADLWYFIQTDPFYKNNTSLIITTDHGRGKQGASWRSHGFWVRGSGEIWLAMMGPDIAASGEMDNNQQLWQKQIASTVALLVGEHFEAEHSIGEPVNFPLSVNLNNNLLITSKATSTK